MLLPLLVAVLAFSATLSSAVVIEDAPCYSDVCEYEFNITSKLVMMYGAEHLSFAKNGVLFYKNYTSGEDIPVPEHDLPGVLIADGFSRVATTINGRMPGPTIEVTEGAQVVVKVRNELENSAATVHWHGMFQRGTPFMDGASFITQCPIAPGQSFTYRFIAEPAGTHMYHAHHGMMRPDGVFGALIVHRKNEQHISTVVERKKSDDERNNVKIIEQVVGEAAAADDDEDDDDDENSTVIHDGEKRSKKKAAPKTKGFFGGDNNQDLEIRDCDSSLVDDAPMVINDWYHESSVELYWQRIGPGFFDHGPEEPPVPWSRGFDGKLQAEIPFTAGLVNGLGRYGDSQTNVTQYTVRKQSVAQAAKNGRPVFCLRMIGAMLEKALRVSVDEHTLAIVASDGMRVERLNVDSVIVHPGETYDVLVLPPAPSERITSLPSRFWIRAATLEVLTAGVQHEGLAVLAYNGDGQDNARRDSIAVGPLVGESSIPSDPTTTSRNCTVDAPCTWYGCPYAFAPPSSFITCLHTNDLQCAESAELCEPPTSPETNVFRGFYNFVFAPLGVNRRKFVMPDRPLLTQFNEGGYVPCASDDVCSKSSCNCTSMINVPFGRVVEIVLANVGPTAFSMHPIHLHGHHFHVMHVGLPVADPVTAKLLNMTTDIDCEPNTLCSRAFWKSGQPPPFNARKPPLKTTVVVPPGGYAVIRFQANNVGTWHMHCHMAHHHFYGMATVLNVDREMAERMFPPPPGFPYCRSFDFEGGHDLVAAARKRWEKLQEKLH